jgi:hypothetical protein
LGIICGRAGTTKTPPARLSEEMMARTAGIDPQLTAAQSGSTAKTGKPECTILS